MPKASSTTQQGEEDNDGSLTDIQGDHKNSSQGSISPRVAWDQWCLRL
jgi:hypothetical protein